MLLVWQVMAWIASGCGQCVRCHSSWNTSDELRESLRLTDQHPVDLGGFVSLTLAQLLTPEQLTHRLVTQCERHVLELDALGHVSHGELVNHLFVDIRSMARRRTVLIVWCAACEVERSERAR